MTKKIAAGGMEFTVTTKLLKVTGLSVKYAGGKISPSLVELEFLNYLNLSENFFRSEERRVGKECLE